MVEQALRFYRDEEASEPVEGGVDMDAVDAGDSVDRTFYVKNEVDHRVDVEGFVLKASSGSVELVSSPETVEPGVVEPVRVRLTPDTAEIAPLKFDLQASYRFKTSN